MQFLDDSERLAQAAACLPPPIRNRLLNFADRLNLRATELRLRLNRPFSVVCIDSAFYITEDGSLTNMLTNKGLLTVTKADIDTTFQKICNYSVYNSQNEIISGFVTMCGGHRAGICGTAVISNEKITNIRDISSINIRIAREHRGCANLLFDKLKNQIGGILICGAPCSGKTTILRDFARLISTYEQKKVALIDERGELAGTTSGVFQNDIGMCDVFNGYPKSSAMIQAIRSMSPDYIVCDEIGSSADTVAISQALNCGVEVVATLHCSSEADLQNKPNILQLIHLGAFKTIVFLSLGSGVGSVSKIIRAGDVIDC